MPSGNSIKPVELGQIDTTPPGTVPSQSIAIYVLPIQVDFQY